MTSPGVTVPECEEFIRGMNPPKNVDGGAAKAVEDAVGRHSSHGTRGIGPNVSARGGWDSSDAVPCFCGQICPEDFEEDGALGQNRKVGLDGAGAALEPFWFLRPGRAPNPSDQHKK